jgi:hypothetical protein
MNNTTIKRQVGIPSEQCKPIKVLALYEFDRNIWAGSTTVCKILRRSGSHTIIDEMLSLNKKFYLRKYRQKRNSVDQLYFLSAQSYSQCLSYEIALSWEELRGISTGFSEIRNENILVCADKSRIDIYVCDNESDSFSRLKMYMGIGGIKTFRGWPDKDIELQIKNLYHSATLV